MRLLKSLFKLAFMVGVVYAIHFYIVFPVFFQKPKVIHLVDADTLLVKDGKKIQQVQLIGVDAPERVGESQSRQCFDDEAVRLAALHYFSNGNEILLEKEDKVGDMDAGGRLLRYVYLKNGDFLNQKLIADGLAKVYKTPQIHYRFQNSFDQVQNLAQQKGLGIWNPQGCAGRF